MSFDFYNWFNSLSINNNETKNYNNALETLVLNDKLDATYYMKEHDLVINNIGFINRDQDEKYFIDIPITRESDIINNFSIDNDNLSISLVINNKVLPFQENTILVPASAIYTELKIRLTFTDQPHNVKLRYKAYLLNMNNRKTLMYNRFTQNGIHYSEGVANYI
jgi:hypothetical protein